MLNGNRDGSLFHFKGVFMSESSLIQISLKFSAKVIKLQQYLAKEKKKI